MTEILVLTKYFVVVMIIIESCVPQELGVFLLKAWVWIIMQRSNHSTSNIHI